MALPAPDDAPEDLIAVGGGLSVARLLAAYHNGIFPWYEDDSPILWWSPDPRMVLFPEEFHCARRLRRTLKAGVFQVTVDAAFDRVIRACAQVPRHDQRGTWITADMQDAYIALHRAGHAHSLECWRDGALAGGLYGVQAGACFCGESMFSKVPDASKTVLAVLARMAPQWGITMIDCQMPTPHLHRMGARLIPRRAYLRRLRQGLQIPPLQETSWRLETPLPTLFARPPAPAKKPRG